MAGHQRITLITGASRGIGRACSEQLSLKGQAIIGLARNKPKDQFPGEFYCVDFTDRPATKNILEQITQEYEINGIVNNVGFTTHQSIENYDLESFNTEIQVNLACSIQSVQACVPSMKRQGFGRIVNISTELVLGHLNRTGYTAAKAGLHALARTWSYELASHGITVNNVAPGPVETKMFIEKNPIGSEQRHAKLAKIPVGRIGTPDDIAGAVCFFMDDTTSWITGQTLFVDGGSGLGGTGLI